MKKILVIISIIAIVFACEKETTTPEQASESSLTYSKNTPKNDGVNSIPFQIQSAGIYDNHLYMSVSYTGGEYGHQFSVSWDEEIEIVDDKKIINLEIFHLTNNDDGTNDMMDSLYIDLSELNIPEDILQDEALWYNVINSSSPENHFLFIANYSNNDDDDDTSNSTEDLEMVVINGECELGLWEGLWLKRSDNSEEYFLPLEIDESINYTPVEDDKLSISFEYTWFEDSTATIDCDFIYNNSTAVIKISELNKIN